MLIHIWIQVLPIHAQCLYYSHCLPEELFVKLIGHYSCKNYSLSGTIISTYQFQKFSTGKIASLPDGVCGAKRLEWRGSCSSKSRLQETCCGGGLDLNGGLLHSNRMPLVSGCFLGHSLHTEICKRQIQVSHNSMLFSKKGGALQKPVFQIRSST